MRLGDSLPFLMRSFSMSCKWKQISSSIPFLSNIGGQHIRSIWALDSVDWCPFHLIERLVLLISQATESIASFTYSLPQTRTTPHNIVGGLNSSSSLCLMFCGVWVDGDCEETPQTFVLFLTRKYLNASTAVLGKPLFGSGSLEIRAGRVEISLRGSNSKPLMNAGTISMKADKPMSKVVRESWPSIYLNPSCKYQSCPGLPRTPR